MVPILQTVNDASLWQLDSVYFRSGLLLFGFEPERTIQFHILRALHDDRSLPVTRRGSRYIEAKTYFTFTAEK